MNTPETHTLRVERRIPAEREIVFRAWTEPEQLRRWSCPTDAVVDDVRVDLRVGGEYMIRMKGPGDSYTAYGTYRVIEPPERLVYTWDWMGDDQKMGETLVTVEFLEAESGTDVVITHERFPTSEARDGHEKGWASCFDQLETACTSALPR